ncbi:MAG: hypothetical protein RR740_00445 [Pseudomonas sp.]
MEAESLHRKVSMALGIQPGVATLEQSIDLVLERNAELEMMVSRMAAEKAGAKRAMDAAIQEIVTSIGDCEIKPKTVKGMFAILRQKLYGERT